MTELHHFLFAVQLALFITQTVLSEPMCSKPGYSTACNYNPQSGLYRIGDNVTYQCNTASRCILIGPIIRSCLENSTWSGKMPVCHKMVELRKIQRIFLVNGSDSYELIDGNEETCSQANSRNSVIWKVIFNKPVPISFIILHLKRNSEAKTRVFGLSNEQRQECFSNVYSSSETQGIPELCFLCGSGYVDALDIVQDTLLRHDKSLQLCEALLFTFPECLVPDQQYMLTSRKLISPTSRKYSFECQNDYELIGENETVCQNDGTWSPISAICREKTQCDRLPPIANGEMQYNSKNSTAWLMCNEGYRPLSHDRTYCLPTKRWSSLSLICILIECNSNPFVPNGYGKLLGGSLYGAKLQVNCNHGYKVLGPQIKECLHNSTWGNLDICIEITCDLSVFEMSANGHWLYLDNKTSIRFLVCNEEYHIIGSPTVTRCLPNGSWSFTTATCIRTPPVADYTRDWSPSRMLLVAVAIGAATAVSILCTAVCFVVVRKWQRSKINTTVLHPDTTEVSVNKDGGNNLNMKEKTTENIELYQQPSNANLIFTYLQPDTDPVYSQPFGTATLSATLARESSTMHIYAEPVNSQRSSYGSNGAYCSVAETWFRNTARKLSRKISLPGRPSSTQEAVQQSNIDGSKTLYYINDVPNTVSNESTSFELKQQELTGLISNSIYLDTNNRSFQLEANSKQLKMIDNEIYQNNHSNV